MESFDEPHLGSVHLSAERNPNPPGLSSRTNILETMQFSNIETLDFEARWAELMMPVEEDNDTDPATVCPRDLEEQTRPVKDDLAFPPCTMYAATTNAPPPQLCMQRLAARKLILRMPLVSRRLSDNQKDMVLNYGSKYPQLVGEIITSSAFANKDVKELEEKLDLKPGILFKWRRCLNVGPTELPYDPLARWTAMAPLLRTARGAKTVEHLELLRINDPTYGSLAPRKELPAKHELPYDPLARWTAMAPLLRTARGAKTVEHLELLRINDPTYGSLAPRSHAFSSAMRIDAWIARMGWLNLYHAGAEEDESGSIEADDEAEVDTSTSSNHSDEAQRPLSPVPANSPVEMKRRLLPRILSGNVLDALADDNDLLSGLSAPPTPKRPETVWKPPAATLNHLYGSLADKRWRRPSSESDDASERSAARTADGRHSGERVSTDTISSYLDESGDPRTSGEWSARSEDLSAEELSARRDLGGHLGGDLGGHLSAEELSAFTAAGHLTEPTKSPKRAVPSAKVKAPWGAKAAPGGELPKDLTKHAAARRQGPFAAGLALLKGEPKADWTA